MCRKPYSQTKTNRTLHERVQAMNNDHKSFSEREGIEQPKLPLREMSDDLRVRLWNAFYKNLPYWDAFGGSHSCAFIYEEIFANFLTLPIDEYSADFTVNTKTVKNAFLHSEWNKVFELIDFVVKTLKHEGRKREEATYYEIVNCFIIDCNDALTKENSIYRIIEGVAAKITDRQEITEIETALKTPYASAKGHLEKALTLFSNRENPDYENSAKESISAVESIAKEITGKHGGTLGQLAGKLDLHDAFAKGLKHLYGFASDAHGIRHGESDEPLPLDEATARFMLVICSAFVNYTIARNPKIQPD